MATKIPKHNDGMNGKTHTGQSIDTREIAEATGIGRHIIVRALKQGEEA
jgi:DNA-binding GntR family transcriptional regulator